ncbi:Bacterial surface antigen (D15) domain-containing protein [Plasmodiophora brassicae]|uniref:Bacterial surface antigen (D15) domain-containing protein n=2 Tax=Plasmodiophora brassicae TaxID=37360 RepID=A0A3P3YCJ5_PLABS|nr:unnamed protein product [Plasmodiophora brassicae]
MTAPLPDDDDDIQVSVEDVLQYADVHVGNIKVTGNVKTNTAFILNEIDLQGVRSLSDIVESCQYAHEDLKQLGIFETVNISLEKGSKGGAVDITVDVKEAQPLQVSTGAEFDSVESSLKLEGVYRNAFGRAESIRLSGLYGLNESGAFDIGYHKPRLYGTRGTLDTNAFLTQINRSRFSSHILGVRGFSAHAVDPTGTFSLGYEGVLRDVIVSGKEASRSIVRDARTSVKSSIITRIALDTRDSPFLPSKGSLLSIKNEFAIPIGGDATFVKCNVDSQFYQPLGQYFTFGLSVKSGLLLPCLYGTAPRPSHGQGTSQTQLPDRFLYGGPLELRGFGQHSVGPRDGKDMLGGDALLAGAANLTFALPHPLLRQLDIRGHIFANCANVVSLTDGSPKRGQLRKLLADMRASVGIGVVIPTPAGRVELNYARPVKAFPHDRTHQFQFGISANFL